MREGWRQIRGGERLVAGRYDREVGLALRFGWDYWQVLALPADYLDELAIAWAVLQEPAPARRPDEGERRKALMARLRRPNLAILGKMKLRPVA